MGETTDGRGVETRLRRANRRTALILAAVALAFFVGIIATRYAESSLMGTGAMGVAALAFLVIAIGRNLRGR